MTQILNFPMPISPGMAWMYTGYIHSGCSYLTMSTLAAIIHEDVCAQRDGSVDDSRIRVAALISRENTMDGTMLAASLFTLEEPDQSPAVMSTSALIEWLDYYLEKYHWDLDLPDIRTAAFPVDMISERIDHYASLSDRVLRFVVVDEFRAAGMSKVEDAYSAACIEAVRKVRQAKECVFMFRGPYDRNSGARKVPDEAMSMCQEADIFTEMARVHDGHRVAINIFPHKVRGMIDPQPFELKFTF